MISAETAHEHIRQCVQALPGVRVPLNNALGLCLVNAIVSDVDSPPFDKALLDGYAISVKDKSPTLRITEQVLAGGVPHHAVEPGTTIRVMTGAPIPDGADAVIKHEDVHQLKESLIQFPTKGVVEGGGIMSRGTSFHSGQEVLPAGKSLTPIDLALIAELGKAKVQVIPRPQVAVLATGNELVDVGRPVGPAQICNSNGPMLLALLESQCVKTTDLGIGRDDPEMLHQLVQQGLKADVLLITGGVSAGVMDLVPGVLEKLGVEKVFHKVRIKPGKPLWFGKQEKDGKSTYVFGMPGNPVSTLVSFELFVKPILGMLGGRGYSTLSTMTGRLTDAKQYRGNRTTYFPCRILYDAHARDKMPVELLPWGGSADLAAMTRANALAIFPAGDYELPAGSEVEVLTLSSSNVI